MRAIALLGTLLGALLLIPAAKAQSLVDGTYQSAGDANGKGQCTLSIRSLEQAHKYGDQVFELGSSGQDSQRQRTVSRVAGFASVQGVG